MGEAVGDGVAVCPGPPMFGPMKLIPRKIARTTAAATPKRTMLLFTTGNLHAGGHHVARRW